MKSQVISSQIFVSFKPSQTRPLLRLVKIPDKLHEAVTSRPKKNPSLLLPRETAGKQ
ncbi:hypothetical protein [Nostoc sp. FACHB-133]|uniref:hypothetical protein n=1 Tax=Nostoc sp. FACHB-133 TaxID=2692835 RepID=UPI001686B21F|nr:hypothetical protein [Nostoc sp. FACHB-133]MBD2521393.1 hypothetical protein [Nostoc sp. FACHB-133]